ncbi:phosphate uptake regulator PhoU [Halorubrum sp. CBA1125]|uniref:AbrB/MazE/SpoVT family DNA-binding domain-containing protein n=1 Tax=Halorubrum sp. CBA1125 TaxID=2668072 RepID=UPI00135EC348|nr:phosphate uptake regulator PhoU [Halorubrum sp. CBA1125]
METRKLQEVGGGTFTVSIPKEWATNHGLEVGMELRLYPHHDGSILVRSSDADVGQLDEATVGVNGDGPEAVRRTVRMAHAVGFETITLRPTGSFTDAERDAARSTVRDLVGTNILTESETEITIRHLLDTSQVSVCQSIAQLQFVAVSLLRDAIEAFVDADDDAYTRIRDRGDEARRSAEMITRHFSRSLVSHAELDCLDVSRPELFVYYATARRLETVVDRAVRIAHTAGKLPEPVPEPVAADVRSATDCVAHAVDDAVSAVLDDETTRVRHARDHSDDAIGQIDALDRELFRGAGVESVPAAVALSSTLAHLRRTANCGRTVADTAARDAIRAENLDI